MAQLPEIGQGGASLRRQCSLYSISVGGKGNNRADRLRAKAVITSGLRPRRSEMLRSLRQYPRTQSQGHHTLVHLEKKGVESGSARQSALEGRERATSIQTNTGTVLKAMLGKLLKRRVGAQMDIPEGIDTSWN